MRTFITLLSFIVFFNCTTEAQKKKAPTYKIVKTKAQWKASLTEMQYYVLREEGTERAYSSPLNNNKKVGTYVCAACKTPLYASKYKYDSHSGWPAFDRAIKNNVALDVDYKIGVARAELKCATCGGHLGHAFNDGPRETTGERHCINGAALEFIPKRN